MGVFRTASALVLIAAAGAGAVQAWAAEGDPNTFTVVGDRYAQAEIAAKQAKAITLRPSDGYPLARRYARLCPRVFGIGRVHAELIEERIRQNVRTLTLAIGGMDCQPNAWIGFARDSRTAVARLRKQQPEMFSSLQDFEVERIFGGSGGAQAWHATEIRNYDGRAIPVVRMDMGNSARPVEAGLNTQYQAGRLKSPIRNDINGTIVIFDSVGANGRTVQQLADYATFRILASVQDQAEVAPGTMPSILHLFATGAEPPDGLTEFDWAYLKAFYRLDRGAKASAIHDATKRTVLDGEGQRLREKAASD